MGRGNQAHLSRGPLNIRLKEALSCHSRCREPPGTREAPQGNRLEVCVRAYVCVIFLFLFSSTRFLPKGNNFWVQYENNQIPVIVCEREAMACWLSCYSWGWLWPRLLSRVVSASFITCFVHRVGMSRPARWSAIYCKYNRCTCGQNSSISATCYFVIVATTVTVTSWCCFQP